MTTTRPLTDVQVRLLRGMVAGQVALEHRRRALQARGVKLAPLWPQLRALADRGLLEPVSASRASAWTGYRLSAKGRAELNRRGMR